jgi:hypothetical protein
MKQIIIGDSFSFEYRLTQLQKVRLMHYSFHHPWMIGFERASNTKIIFSLLPNILKQECDVKKFPYLSPARKKEQYINNIITGTFDVSLKDKIIIDTREIVYLITGVKSFCIECNPSVLTSRITFITTKKTRIHYKPVASDKVYRMTDLEITNFLKSGDVSAKAVMDNVNEVFINIPHFPFE